MAAAQALPRSSTGRGCFVVFEGVDRCGKTTQSTKLFEFLQGQQVRCEAWRFPDRKTLLGGTIDGYLKNAVQLDDAAIHLLFSANRWEKRAELVAKLQAGCTVVCDRYSMSGVAYTAAKRTPGADLEWCMAPEKGLPAPDIVIYLQVDPEVSASRGGYGEERYEKLALQQQVAAQYAQLRESFPHLKWLVLDATLPPNDLHKQISAAVLEHVQRCSEGGCAIAQLWDGAPLPLPAAAASCDATAA